VQLEFTQMAQYASDCAPAKVILIEHDITLDLYQQLLKSNDDWEVSRQLDRWIPFEVSAWREVDRVVTMSEKDRQFTISFGMNPQRTVCLPNGVDLKHFQPICTPPEPRCTYSSSEHSLICRTCLQLNSFCTKSGRRFNCTAQRST
jgi:glycosyltransferase involved in cell wall biosynthesis